MQVKELIALLQEYDGEAKAEVVVHNRAYDFTLSISGAEGCDKQNCDSVGFYVDELNGMEERNG